MSAGPLSWRELVLPEFYLKKKESPLMTVTVEGAMDTSVHVCPHLRLAGDPGMRWLSATPEHRCHRLPRPARIPEEHQVTLCLSGRYGECLVELGVQAALRGGASWLRESVAGEMKLPVVRIGLMAVAGLVVLLMSFSLLLISAPASAVDASPGEASPSWVVAEMGPAAGPVVPMLSAPAGPVVPVPSAELIAPVMPALAMAGMEALPAATASLSNPSGVGSSAATAATLPAGPAEGGRVHEVEEGDTLWSLSLAFGVTIEELMEANDLEDRSLIWLGQQLVIPDPAP